MKKKNGLPAGRQGFTLIELLVAMTIVAILMALALVSFQGARQSSRDGRRKADLEQVRSALEMYRADNGLYPASTSDLSGYISIPSDPTPGRLYPYVPNADKTTYTLCASLEISSEIPTGCGSCGTGMTCNYQVTSP